MGLWDDLNRLLRRGRKKATEKAAKAAAKEAVDTVKEKVEEAGKGFLEFAEGELGTAQKAREGRVEVRPSGNAAAEIAASIEASAKAAEASEKAPTTTEKERKEKAEAELARLKAELKDKLYGPE